MKKYPVLDQVLADVPARKAGVPIPKDSKGLTPTVKKAIIKELYAAIGERIFHWDSSQIQWMHNIIDKFMSARDVEREWEFIQKGHVEQLLKLMQQIQEKADEDDEADLGELQKIWEDVAQGIIKTKEAHQEIDDETWGFVEKNLMEFVDKFNDKLEHKVPKKKLNTPDRPKLGEPERVEYWEPTKTKHSYEALGKILPGRMKSAAEPDMQEMKRLEKDFYSLGKKLKKLVSRANGLLDVSKRIELMPSELMLYSNEIEKHGHKLAEKIAQKESGAKDKK